MCTLAMENNKSEILLQRRTQSNLDHGPETKGIGLTRSNSFRYILTNINFTRWETSTPGLEKEEHLSSMVGRYTAHEETNK